MIIPSQKLQNWRKKVEMMKEQTDKKDQIITKKDQQINILADLYNTAIKQIQNLETELQEAKSIVSAAVAKSIGAKSEKKGAAVPRAAKNPMEVQASTNAVVLNVLKE